jgi:hypothetical protein
MLETGIFHEVFQETTTVLALVNEEHDQCPLIQRPVHASIGK